MTRTGIVGMVAAAWLSVFGVLAAGDLCAADVAHETSVHGGMVYYVDRNHASASDENPGTKDLPWKTLTHAGKTADAGDHVYIRGGVYRETLSVEHSGFLDRNCPLEMNRRARKPTRIAFEATGDEPVIIDGSEIVPPELWTAVDQVKDVYVADLSKIPGDWVVGRYDGVSDGPAGFVFLNDALLSMHEVRDIETGESHKAVPGTDDVMTRYYDKESRGLYVNLGGVDPRDVKNRVEVTVRSAGVTSPGAEYITISKFTVRRVSGTAVGSSLHGIIEDCNIYHVGAGGRFGGIVRRNRVHHSMLGSHFGGLGSMIYDNIISDFSLAAPSVYQRYAFTIFSQHYVRFLHNIAYQSPPFRGGGFWTDCPGVSHIWRGNAGIYADYFIESPPVNNLLEWNTALYTTIGLKNCYAGTVSENLAAWSPGPGITLDGYGRGSKNSLASLNWLKQNRVGISSGAEPGKPGVQEKNFAQGNIYEVPKDGFAANWAGRPYKTLEELRAATGQETLGEEREIDLDELGLVWVRLDEVKDSYKPFPMFGNPYLSRIPGCTRNVRDPLFFWSRGNAEWRGHGDRVDTYPGPRTKVRKGGAYSGSRLHDEWSIGPADEQTGLDGYRYLAPVEGTPVEGTVYVVSSFTNTALDRKGYGLWSRSLPVVGGATIDIELWMNLVDVEPVEENGGAVAYVEWSDWTGQNKSRGYLVGGDTGDAIVNPACTRGTLDWTKVVGTVRAPAEAKRFSLYLGMRHAAGQVMYDAIETIRTRPGEPPPEAVTAGKKADDKPLMDPGKLEFSIVDLSGFVNRALADDEANDGKGGWTDQGAGYDMKGLETGRIEQDGVPYNILTPRSCIVLNSTHRPQSKLPESVRIPVGEKADVLYFLHSGAWMSGGHGWSYELCYEDGSVFTIPVISGVSIRDWGSAGEPYEFLNTDTRRATVWKQIVGNTLSPACGLFILEHINPHPDRVIKSIVFQGRHGVPILLNITLGRTKESS